MDIVACHGIEGDGNGGVLIKAPGDA